MITTNDVVYERLKQGAKPEDLYSYFEDNGAEPEEAVRLVQEQVKRLIAETAAGQMGGEPEPEPMTVLTDAPGGFTLLHLVGTIAGISVAVIILSIVFSGNRIARGAANAYVKALNDGTIVVSCHGKDNNGDDKITCVTKEKSGTVVPIVCESTWGAAIWGAGCEPKNFVNIPNGTAAPAIQPQPQQ